MAKGKTLPIIKESGVKQRSDVELTKDIAITIRNYIISGEPIYSEKEPVTHTYEEDGEEKTIKLSRNQINMWCIRGNVIPDIGITLKEYVDKAREEYRNNLAEEKRKKLLEKVEENFIHTQNLRTSEAWRKPVPIYEMDEDGKMRIKGYKTELVTDEHGRPIRRENPKLLAVKMKNAEFIAERLNSEKYGKVDKLETKSLVFSLSDLRKAKEERDKIRGEQ